MLKGSKNICVIYRMCIKIMNTLSPNSVFTSVQGKTTVFNTDLKHSNVSVPSMITWKDVHVTTRPFLAK